MLLICCMLKEQDINIYFVIANKAVVILKVSFLVVDFMVHNLRHLFEL